MGVPGVQSKKVFRREVNDVIGANDNRSDDLVVRPSSCSIGYKKVVENRKVEKINNVAEVNAGTFERSLLDKSKVQARSVEKTKRNHQNNPTFKEGQIDVDTKGSNDNGFSDGSVTGRRVVVGNDQDKSVVYSSSWNRQATSDLYVTHYSGDKSEAIYRTAGNPKKTIDNSKTERENDDVAGMIVVNGFGLLLVIAVIVFCNISNVNDDNSFPVLNEVVSQKDGGESVALTPRQQTADSISSSIVAKADDLTEGHFVVGGYLPSVYLDCVSDYYEYDFLLKNFSTDDGAVDQLSHDVYSRMKVTCSSLDYRMALEKYDTSFEKERAEELAILELSKLKNANGEIITPYYIAYIQSVLNLYNHNIIDVDGRDGPATRRAIRKWKVAYDINFDGDQPSYSLLSRIMLFKIYNK